MSYMEIRVCIYVYMCAYVCGGSYTQAYQEDQVLERRGHLVILHRWVCCITNGPQPVSWGRNPPCLAEASVTLSGSRGPHRHSAGSKRLRNEQMYLKNHKCLEADRSSSPFLYWESNLIHVITPLWGFISLFVKQEHWRRWIFWVCEVC